ncbi:recombinase family protein [Streptobacillus felis]|uniref:recombinase family protein n=1 Tax=Streptobacillus felis TaxID=1384509 RepID=UPI00082DE144|nr:recombinase family protein [Streptobacillus felis]
MNKVTLYMRISVEEFGDRIESESISSQRLLITDYIVKDSELRSYEKVEYIDDGYSGTNINRPSFTKLMDDVKQGKINCIIVKDLSRFLREYILIGEYIENIFPFLNVRFVSINDRYDSFKEKGNGTDLDIQFRSLLYDFYSKDVSDKVKTSMTIQKKQGKYLAWSPPYGYMKDPNDKYSIVVDEVVAPVVKKIFSLYLDGLSTRKIALLMNEEGHIVPSIRKKKLTNMDYSYNILDYKGKKYSWTNGTITDILMNENYTGTYVFNMHPKTEIGGNKARFLPKDEWERVPNNHEAIISMEDFEKVRNLKEKNQFMEKKNTDFEWYKKSPLQSIVRCSTCGHILTCQTTRRKKKDGSPYELFYFRCRICPQRGSESNSIRADKLEDKAFELLKDKLEIKESKFKSTEAKKDALVKQISDLEKQKDLSYEKFKLGKISREKFISLKSKYDSEIEFLKDSLSATAQQQESQSFTKLTREIVQENFRSIYVKDGEIIEIEYVD